MNTHRIEISNRQNALTIESDWIRRAIKAVLVGEGIQWAEINVAIVGNVEIHKLNREFLNHDMATDVLSFSLGDDEDLLEGELMVSAEKAVEMAPHFGWSPHDELGLYVIHGTLHLAGYDDLESEAERTMRERETHYLAEIGTDVTCRGGEYASHETDRADPYSGGASL